MAKQNPASDPVSQAMLAIEDALNLGSETEATSPNSPETVSAPAAAAQPSPPPAPEPIAATPPLSLKAPAPAPRAAEPLLSRQTPAAPPARPASRDGRAALPGEPPPANDDRASVRPIMQALKTRKPSRAPIIAASVLSLAWFVACALYAWQKYAGQPWREALLTPEAGMIALGAIGPILVVFAFAAFARRLYELRLSAASIAQVAMRLAEPETSANENFITLSQAIRRELETLGAGVEKAYNRANELDSMVRAEVTAIERASGESERRIRSLIAELSDQREQIVSHGEQLRAALGGAHEQISSELKAAGEVVTESAQFHRRTHRRVTRRRLAKYRRLDGRARGRDRCAACRPRRSRFTRVSRQSATMSPSAWARRRARAPISS